MDPVEINGAKFFYMLKKHIWCCRITRLCFIYINVITIFILLCIY